ncbi:hypothetical protein KSP39_PZI014731 [Platanthera zijinensis]|uniref:Uncharacterized protein n=1 Tax=Platanthera zijinensis TaxID=2320716 RepID=A0AAP0G2I2_9ASPA
MPLGCRFSTAPAGPKSLLLHRPGFFSPVQPRFNRSRTVHLSRSGATGKAEPRRCSTPFPAQDLLHDFSRFRAVVHARCYPTTPPSALLDFKVVLQYRSIVISCTHSVVVGHAAPTSSVPLFCKTFGACRNAPVFHDTIASSPPLHSGSFFLRSRPRCKRHVTISSSPRTLTAPRTPAASGKNPRPSRFSSPLPPTAPSSLSHTTSAAPTAVPATHLTAADDLHGSPCRHRRPPRPKLLPLCIHHTNAAVLAVNFCHNPEILLLYLLSTYLQTD